METKKVLDALQPMREVQNALETAALDGEALSASTLLYLTDKLMGVDMAIMKEHNRELTAESDRLSDELKKMIGGK